MTGAVTDVAAHILNQAGPMTAMKLHRLCFYAYGYHLAWEGRRLFPERFEAWANGPVVPALHEAHRGRFELGPGDIPGDPGLLDDGERESVGIVLEQLGHLSAHELSVMTHQDAPWRLARVRSGVGLIERSSEPLRDDEIAEHFEALAAVAAEAKEPAR